MSLGGCRTISVSKDSIFVAVAQTHTKFLFFIEGVRGMRNTSDMETTKKSQALKAISTKT